LTPGDAQLSVGEGTLVAISDWSGACALGLNAVKQNGKAVVFDFSHISTLTAGTFNVGPQVDVQYATYDQTCGSPTGESATGGTVTITTVDACSASGTFDVTLNQDHISGTFTARKCTNAATGAKCAP
jgi:hypothetical protein